MKLSLLTILPDLYVGRPKDEDAVFRENRCKRRLFFP
jgi:hypothetical protein